MLGDPIYWKQGRSANAKCGVPASAHQAAVVMVGKGAVGRLPQWQAVGSPTLQGEAFNCVDSHTQTRPKVLS